MHYWGGFALLLQIINAKEEQQQNFFSPLNILPQYCQVWVPLNQHVLIKILFPQLYFKLIALRIPTMLHV